MDSLLVAKYSSLGPWTVSSSLSTALWVHGNLPVSEHISLGPCMVSLPVTEHSSLGPWIFTPFHHWSTQPLTRKRGNIVQKTNSPTVVVYNHYSTISPSEHTNLYKKTWKYSPEHNFTHCCRIYSLQYHSRWPMIWDSVVSKHLGDVVVHQSNRVG